MTNRKTLNQILKQNTFSGADVGKALLMLFIQEQTEQKQTLSDSDFEIMLNSIKTKKQLDIYKTYYLLKGYINDFQNMAKGNFQQYQNGYKSLISDLNEFRHCQHNYKDYLNLPLVLNENEYNKIKTDALKDYNEHKIDLYTLILWTICDYVESYKENKDIPEQIKNILDGYKNETIKIEYENEILNATGETAEQTELKAFADKYGIENTHEAISKFISSSIVSLIEDNLPTEKTLKKDSQKLLNSCELYEKFKELEFNYLNEYDLTGKAPKKNKIKFEHFSEQVEKSYKTVIELKELSKIDALKELCSDFLDYYNDNSRDKTTAELQQEFIKDFPALYKTVKDILSSKYSKFKTLKDSELLTAEITNKEQLKAGFIKPLSEEKIRDITRQYFIELEPKNTKEFIKRYKAQYGGIAVLYGESSNIFDKNLFKKFSKDPFNTLIPENVIPQRIEIYIKKLIEPAIYTIFGFNYILEVYSDVFKIDLSDLKMIYDFEKDFECYNSLIYTLYNKIIGTDEQIIADKISFKEIFKPLKLEKYKIPQSKLDALKNEIENIPLQETLTNKYFKQLLQGANIIYDE